MFTNFGPLGVSKGKVKVNKIKWYKNRKLWISIVSLVVVILSYFGISVSPELQSQIVDLINVVIGMVG